MQKEQLKFRCLGAVLLLSTLVLGGCASGDWASYNYGPADWLHDRGIGTWETIYNYEKLADPEIRIHRVSNVQEICGNFFALGCAKLQGDVCVIWIGERGQRSTLDHELRHCHGWDHHRVDHSFWYSRDRSSRERELARAGGWYPSRSVTATQVAAEF